MVAYKVIDIFGDSVFSDDYVTEHIPKDELLKMLDFEKVCTTRFSCEINWFNPADSKKQPSGFYKKGEEVFKCELSRSFRTLKEVIFYAPCDGVYAVEELSFCNITSDSLLFKKYAPLEYANQYLDIAIKKKDPISQKVILEAKRYLLLVSKATFEMLYSFEADEDNVYMKFCLESNLKNYLKSINYVYLIFDDGNFFKIPIDKKRTRSLPKSFIYREKIRPTLFEIFQNVNCCTVRLELNNGDVTDYNTSYNYLFKNYSIIFANRLKDEL